MAQADVSVLESTVNTHAKKLLEKLNSSFFFLAVANRGLYSTLVLLFHFFTWERAPLAEEEKKHVFPPFRAVRECSADMHPLDDTATPTEAQAIPWACGLKFTVRDPDSLADWLAHEDQ